MSDKRDHVREAPTMLERCARAMWPLVPVDGTADIAWWPQPAQHKVEWDNAEDKEQILCQMIARAMLTELREPDKAMKEEFWLEFQNYATGRNPEEDFFGLWRAMIDAVLDD